MTILDDRSKQIHRSAVSMKAAAEKLRALPTVEGLVVLTPAFVESLSAMIDNAAEIFDGIALCMED